MSLNIIREIPWCRNDILDIAEQSWISGLCEYVLSCEMHYGIRDDADALEKHHLLPKDDPRDHDLLARLMRVG